MVRLSERYRAWLPGAGNLPGVLLVAAVFWALGHMGFSLSSLARPQAVTVALAAGFAIAVYLIWGYHFWVGVFLGAMATALESGASLSIALGAGVASAFGNLVGAYLMREWAGFQNSLERLRDVFALLLFGVLVARLVASGIGMANLWLAGTLRGEQSGLAMFYFNRVIGGGIGVLIATPFLLAFSQPLKQPLTRASALEALGILLLLSITGVLVFSPLVSSQERDALAYLLIPFVIWAAIRFEVRGAAVASLLVLGITLLASARGYGAFAGSPRPHLYIALFNSVAAITGLIVAASSAERRQTGTLREAMELLRNVLDRMPVGVWIADREGRITSANPAAERIWRGGTANAYRGWGARKKWSLEMHDWLRSRATGAAATAAEEKIEVRAADGSRKMLLSSAIPLLDSGGQQIGAVAVHQDVTDMVRAEQSLRELAAIVEQSDDIIYVTDRSGFIEYVNPGFEKHTGYAGEEAIGRTPAVLKSGKHDRSFYSNLWATILAGKPFREVLLNRRKSGENYYEAKTISPIRNSEGEITHFVSTGKDITERMQAEEALRDYAGRLRQLSRRLIETEENERRELARELHDRVGQNVTALTLNLAMLRGELPADGQQKVGAHLDDCEQLLDHTAQLIRDVMVELRPPGLDELGLAAALTEYARQVARRSGFSATVRSSEATPRLPPATEITLFRISQEALTNVAKHARATEVTIALESGATTIVLTIADNGRGFDTSGPAEHPRTSLGMVSMRERAESIGARLRVESAPGQGTRVIVEAPCAASSPAQPGLFK